MDIETGLSKAQEYADGGRKFEARRLLRRIIEADNRNEKAWFLFSRVAERKEHEIQCLKRVLFINPTNEQARKRLSVLQPRKMRIEDATPPASGDKTEKAEEYIPARFHHPRLTPPVITDPFNPLFINILLKIESEKMQFFSDSMLFQVKKLGEEKACDIGNIRLEHRTAGERRREIFKRSVLRGFLWMIVFLFFFLLNGSYGIMYLLPMLLITGGATGLLHFLFLGGFTIWDDKVRLTCTLSREQKPFILEIDMKTEAEVIGALLRNGMDVDGTDSLSRENQ